MASHRHKTLGSPVAPIRQCALAFSILGCTTSPRVHSVRHSAQLAVQVPIDAGARTESEPVASSDQTVAPLVTYVPRTEQPPKPEASADDPTDLVIDHFEPAAVRWAMSSDRAPLFVVTHGAGGQAQWHCTHYASLLGPDVTLVCPRGKRMYAREPDRGYYYPNHHELQRELREVVETLLNKYAERFAHDALVYVGYSQGASMGVLAVAEQGADFKRLLLVEGGYDNWSELLSKRFVASGGRRVLFVCGTKQCQHGAQTSIGLLKRAGALAQLRNAMGAGHRPDGPVADAVRDGLSWLLDDAREFASIRDNLAKSALARQIDQEAAASDRHRAPR